MSRDCYLFLETKGNSLVDKIYFEKQGIRMSIILKIIEIIIEIFSN